ncbi:hypothetical protein DFH28DRAFT_609059 [Melampsora americana]|nr:hypothetical protein DFH28DRAFT_609059 [Melampsora americana]
MMLLDLIYLLNKFSIQILFFYGYILTYTQPVLILTSFVVSYFFLIEPSITLCILLSSMRFFFSKGSRINLCSYFQTTAVVNSYDHSQSSIIAIVNKSTCFTAYLLLRLYPSNEILFSSKTKSIIN